MLLRDDKSGDFCRFLSLSSTIMWFLRSRCCVLFTMGFIAFGTISDRCYMFITKLLTKWIMSGIRTKSISSNYSNYFFLYHCIELTAVLTPKIFQMSLWRNVEFVLLKYTFSFSYSSPNKCYFSCIYTLLRLPNLANSQLSKGSLISICMNYLCWWKETCFMWVTNFTWAKLQGDKR